MFGDPGYTEILPMTKYIGRTGRNLNHSPTPTLEDSLAISAGDHWFFRLNLPRFCRTNRRVVFRSGETPSKFRGQ